MLHDSSRHRLSINNGMGVGRNMETGRVEVDVYCGYCKGYFIPDNEWAGRFSHRTGQSYEKLVDEINQARDWAGV